MDSRLVKIVPAGGYFQLSGAELYYEWALGERELAESKLSFFEGWSRFISGYEYQNAEVGGEVRRVANYVSFDEEFVRELIGRSLFGIRWKNVDSVERSTIKPKE